MKDEFLCPSCQAPYKIVRVQTDSQTRLADVKCTECDFPFTAYESGHILKYFQTAPAKIWKFAESQ